MGMESVRRAAIVALMAQLGCCGRPMGGWYDCESKLMLDIAFSLPSIAVRDFRVSFVWDRNHWPMFGVLVLGPMRVSVVVPIRRICRLTYDGFTKSYKS